MRELYFFADILMLKSPQKMRQSQHDHELRHWPENGLDK